MADENDEQVNEEENGEEGKSKPRKKINPIIIWVVVGVLVVAGSVGGTLFMLGVFDSDEAEEVVEEEAAEAQDVVAKPDPAMYFPIKPAFIVTLPSKGRQRMLSVEVTIMTRDSEIFNGLQTHMPLVKNRLVMLLGGEIYEELQTAEGKELLRQKALQAMQDIMQQEIGKPAIEQVLFTNFVMQ